MLAYSSMKSSLESSSSRYSAHGCDRADDQELRQKTGREQCCRLSTTNAVERVLLLVGVHECHLHRPLNLAGDCRRSCHRPLSL